MDWMMPMMAAAADRSHAEEDQLLAALTQQDTAQRYEFKILHGGATAFRGKGRMQRVLEEEARAQWELAIKLDDARVALRRSRDARSRDALRSGDIDPYRTELASNRSAAVASVLAISVLIVLVVGLLVERRGDLGGSEAVTWSLFLIAIVTGLALVKLVLIRRR